ncbi:MAG: hypothetical protein ACE5IR_09860 [bacterium]
MIKRYDAYKPSGVGWIGEIPEQWEVKKLKYVASLREEMIEDADFKIAVEDIQSGTGHLKNQCIRPNP